MVADRHSEYPQSYQPGMLKNSDLGSIKMWDSVTHRRSSRREKDPSIEMVAGTTIEKVSDCTHVVYHNKSRLTPLRDLVQTIEETDMLDDTNYSLDRTSRVSQHRGCASA